MRLQRRGRVGGAGAAALGGAALAALLAVVGPAGAAVPDTAQHGSVAGYATVSTGITSFSGSMTVPTLTCPTQSTNISVYSQVQAGNVQFELAGDCNSTSQYFAAYATAAGANAYSQSHFEVWAGQKVTYSATWNLKTGSTKLVVTNATTKASTSLFLPSGIAVPLSYEVQFEACCGSPLTPIPAFTPWVFGPQQINGASLATLSPTQYNMYNGTVLQAATSALTTAGGFTVTFKHA
jgi:hypothetical protein